MIIVGAGNMAMEYARVLAALGVGIDVIGNREASGDKFYEWAKSQGITARVRFGGVAKNAVNDDYAIVAVPVSLLYDVTKTLIGKGVKHILVEKPGALYTVQMRAVAYLANAHGVDVRIAYNRRFLNSVQSARTIARRDGLRRLHFCFGDDMDAVRKTNHPEEVKRKWIVANSSHVIDAALFIGDGAQHIYAESTWPFRGAGYGADYPISYSTDWDKDKRWHIEFETRAGERYYLAPIEKLTRVDGPGQGTVIAFEEGDLKPGLEAMVWSFMHDKHDLPTAGEQLGLLQLCDRIGGYKE